MNSLIKLVTIIVVMNIFMYLAVNFSISADGNNQLNKHYKFHFSGDAFDNLFNSRAVIDNIAESSKTNWTNYNLNFTSGLVTEPTQESGVSDTGGGSVLPG